MDVLVTLSGPINEIQRRQLECRLVENFYALLFHREGYRSSDVPQEIVEEIALIVEAKAYSHVVRAADLGMSSGQMLQTYAREAATLLLSEVEKYCIPVEAAPLHASAGAEVDPQELSLNEISGGLRSIQTAPLQQQRPNRSRDAWGWLEPGSRVLPYVVLKGSGVAIGRGKEALWAVAGSSNAVGSPRSALACGSDRHLSEVLKRNLGFVEVADGRVSRLHCIISMAEGPDGTLQAMLQDCSSNGTFLDGRQLSKGESVPLADGMRISLVRSVAPLVEQYFLFHAGNPADPDAAGSDGQSSWVGSTHSPAGVFSPGAMHSASPSGAASSSIFRTATSRYTTFEQSTLEDLKCQICLNTLKNCVALEPCGHNFCATCLSHHLGNQLQSGLQLSCPFRCPPPDRIVINYAVRGLIGLLSSSGRPLSSHHSRQAAGGTTGVSGGRQSMSRSGSRGLHTAFGQAAGSTSSLPSLAAAAQAAAASVGAQQNGVDHQQQQTGSGTGAAVVANRQGSVPLANGGSSLMGRAASSTSASSFDAAAGSAAGTSGLPGVAEAGSTQAANTVSGGNYRTDVTRSDSLEADYYTQNMSLLCPLDDEHLPMEAANLKTRQVEVALSQLKVESCTSEEHLICLEALARLAWSDDTIRELVANSGGVRSIVDVMTLHSSSDSIQCHACLALMSLVRGEGEVCQSNQWHVAKAGAIEVIAQAMRQFRDSAMVQLSVLLCLIPLALENAMMQAHITQECLTLIVSALDRHRSEVDIQTKGLVLLGVLIQGDDAVHDAVRIRELEAAVPKRVVAALRQHGTSNDDVLWAALFVLAVLVRDNSCVFGRAAGALARAGVLKVLQSAVEEYKQRHEHDGMEPDEMIVSAGDYLVQVLEPVQVQLNRRNYVLAAVTVTTVAVCAGILARRLWSEGGSSGQPASHAVVNSTATAAAMGNGSSSSDKRLLTVRHIGVASVKV